MSNTCVLITGATGGLGRAFADAFAARGCAMVLSARDPARLDALAAALRERHGIEVATVPADLADPASREAAIAAIEAGGRAVDVLVNNAGFSTLGLLSALDWRDDRDLVEVNVAAVVRLCHAFLPAMAARGHGAVINVGSTTSFHPLPRQAAYAASKAFVLSFSEALHGEYRRHGVHVMALCPGAIDTGFFQAMGRDVTLSKASPEAVVAAALRGLDARRAVVVPGLANALQSALLPRLLPRAAVRRLVDWAAPRAYAPDAIARGP
ncbi:MAG: SDR family NAD(P)-dependent oxidoreductase [Lysobacteraceae bacterium]